MFLYTLPKVSQDQFKYYKTEQWKNTWYTTTTENSSGFEVRFGPDCSKLWAVRSDPVRSFCELKNERSEPDRREPLGTTKLIKLTWALNPDNYLNKEVTGGEGDKGG